MEKKGTHQVSFTEDLLFRNITSIYTNSWTRKKIFNGKNCNKSKVTVTVSKNPV